ncbi:unnamed protein product [Notodromas monacha]|uniref:Uncharacterized protein n=1 Tax=Notodromas monacha TaxID=399045 RepID=A0A7R9GEX2_9CRUS|nr:unnamed protein product [Notodromas monacha]CAG0920096.1 unnamed protein product [Notodromas monacha]
MMTMMVMSTSTSLSNHPTNEAKNSNKSKYTLMSDESEDSIRGPLGKSAIGRILTAEDKDSSFLVLMKPIIQDSTFDTGSDPGCLISERAIVTFYQTLDPASWSFVGDVVGVNATAGKLKSASESDVQVRYTNNSNINKFVGYTNENTADVNSVLKNPLAIVTVTDPFIIGDAVKPIRVSINGPSLVGMEVQGLYSQAVSTVTSEIEAQQINITLTGTACPSSISGFQGTLDPAAVSCLRAGPDVSTNGCLSASLSSGSAIVVRGTNGGNYLVALARNYNCDFSTKSTTIIGSSFAYASHKDQVCGLPGVVCEDAFPTTTTSTSTTTTSTTTTAAATNKSTGEIFEFV